MRRGIATCIVAAAVAAWLGCDQLVGLSDPHVASDGGDASNARDAAGDAEASAESDADASTDAAGDVTVDGTIEDAGAEDHLVPSDTAVACAGNTPNGTPCGVNLVCHDGMCQPCTAGIACTPMAPCDLGTYSCATGVPVCIDTGIAVPDGTSCGGNMFCTAGMCISCQPGASCTLPDPCHIGVTSCFPNGMATCNDYGTLAGDGTSCNDGGGICQGGICGCGPGQSACASDGGTVCIHTGTCCTDGDCSGVGEVCSGPGGSCDCPASAPYCGAAGGCLASTTCCPDCASAGGACSPNGAGPCVCPDGHPLQSATDCGACGHDCQGGTCLFGVCQPVLLASGQDYPEEIAVAAATVYWTACGGPCGGTTQGGLASVPVGGGSPTTLASTSASFAVDSTSLYFFDGFAGAIEKMPLAGGSVTTLAAAPAGAHLTVDSTSLYFTTFSAVLAVGIGGGMATTLASGVGTPTSLAVGATDAYWGENGGGVELMDAPLGGGGASTLVAGNVSSYGVAVDATSVYWTATSNAVMSIPVAGGAVTTIASGQANPMAIAVDGSGVYWVNNLAKVGTVMKAALGGGGVTTLAAAQDSPTGIALDTTTVYWTDYGSGTVMKVAKP